MVFGGAEHEHIQLNKAASGPESGATATIPPDMTAVSNPAACCRQVRSPKLSLWADRDMIDVPRRMPHYQTLGDLTIDFTEQETVSGHRC
jgi:hypothetical protein